MTSDPRARLVEREHWAVSVFRNGDNILTIESNFLAGKDLTPEDEETVRNCARHLLSFVGEAALALSVGEATAPISRSDQIKRAFAEFIDEPNQAGEATAPWQPLAVELGRYLETLTITGDNIGDIRRSMFMPWDSAWNALVRDETALRELPSSPSSPATDRQGS